MNPRISLPHLLDQVLFVRFCQRGEDRAVHHVLASTPGELAAPISQAISCIAA